MINPVIFIIFGGVVGTILVFSFILNILGAVFGPWSKLAAEWPAAQIPPGKPRTGVFAVTSDPYSVQQESRRSYFGLIAGLSSVLFLGLIVIIAGMLMGWIQSPVFLRGLTIAIWGLFTISMCYWALRFLRQKAFPQLVQCHTDDDHIHIRRDSDVVTKYPWISIPWAAISELSPDPADPSKVRFHMGPYWAYADADLVADEIRIRSELAELASLQSGAPTSF